MDAESLKLTRQLMEYSRQKGVPGFVREAADLLAVLDSGCDRLFGEIDRLRARLNEMDSDSITTAGRTK